MHHLYRREMLESLDESQVDSETPNNRLLEFFMMPDLVHYWYIDDLIFFQIINNSFKQRANKKTP